MRKAAISKAAEYTALCGPCRNRFTSKSSYLIGSSFRQASKDSKVRNVLCSLVQEDREGLSHCSSRNYSCATDGMSTKGSQSLLPPTNGVTRRDTVIYLRIREASKPQIEGGRFVAPPKRRMAGRRLLSITMFMKFSSHDSSCSLVQSL